LVSKSRPGERTDVAVAGAGVAVVAHDAVGDEVFGPGGDVVEAHAGAERFDTGNGTRWIYEYGLTEDALLHGATRTHQIVVDR
jgi:hypothetical protein